jgi:hypothetical protein
MHYVKKLPDTCTMENSHFEAGPTTNSKIFARGEANANRTLTVICMTYCDFVR